MGAYACGPKDMMNGKTIYVNSDIGYDEYGNVLAENPNKEEILLGARYDPGMTHYKARNIRHNQTVREIEEYLTSDWVSTPRYVYTPQKTRSSWSVSGGSTAVNGLKVCNTEFTECIYNAWSGY